MKKENENLKHKINELSGIENKKNKIKGYNYNKYNEIKNSQIINKLEKELQQ